MGHPVVTVREIVATDACGMMVGTGFVTKHDFCHDCINAVAALLGKTLDRDLVPFLCRSEHPSRQDFLHIVVEVTLHEDDSSHLVDPVIAWGLLKQNGESHRPPRKYNTLSCTCCQLCSVKSGKVFIKTRRLIMSVVPPTEGRCLILIGTLPVTLKVRNGYGSINALIPQHSICVLCLLKKLGSPDVSILGISKRAVQYLLGTIRVTKRSHFLQ